MGFPMGDINGIANAMASHERGMKITEDDESIKRVG